MRVSGAGEARFQQALPHWRKAQTHVRRQLGKELSDRLMKLTQETANSLID
jgi:hypothetical protein